MYINGGKALKKAHNSGFLTRLAKNQAGNVLPLAAAAVFPMAGMIGGAVDLGRIYMTQARLQNACDAGALATRRAMTGTTPTTDNVNEGKKFFDFNFPSGTFGVDSITRTYGASPVVGTVSGSASAVVPATVMKIFGRTSFNVAVSCSSTLNIPNTDVVFVLDFSGSMQQTISGDSQSKIAGLRQAVKDFYKELGPGETSGPGRIRYGFVPYSSNVNVGYSLNPSWVMDSPSYQTQVANVTQVWTYELGSESAKSSWSSWSPSSMPTSFNNASGFSGWARISSTASNTTTVGGTTYRHRHSTASNTTTCAALNTLSGSSGSMIARSDVAGTVAGPTLQSTTNDPATYVAGSPPTQQVLTYRNQEAHTVNGYRYRWQTVSSVAGCWFERGNGSYTKTQTATSTKSITWTQRDRVTGWSFAQANINITGLKNGSNWNTSFSVPNQTSTSLATNLSGTGATTIDVPGPATINWAGCIEEASTVNTITSSYTGTVPGTAYDLSIDLVPDEDAERWKPHLPALVWDPTDGQWQADATWQSNGWAQCPGQARRLTSYTGDLVSGVSAGLSSYIDALPTIGGTQHDIGMIWGARFLSPDGIFAAENKDSAAPGGFQVGRHLVFMTDGAMDARNQNYGPWGISRVEGRQVPTSQLDTDNGSQDMNNVHYKRMAMICDAAKSKGYTIWVIGFGLSSMPAALQNCATDSDHASLASNTTQLKAKFKAIAETIGGLRLSI